jgi:hypothetical protein
MLGCTPLPRSPDLMTNEQLSQWVQRLVDDQVPESLVLDYKRKPYDLAVAEAKIELAKDASSFANSQGGALLLGIGEKKNALKQSVPVRTYGVHPTPEYEARVRDVLAASLSPPLPEARVMWIPKVGDGRAGIYLLWHPESWLSPHMVQDRIERRYYRRDADVSRPVPMGEQDVERLYRVRAAGEERASRLLDSMDYLLGRPRTGDPHMFVCVAPRLLLDNAIDLTRPQIQEWLVQNRFTVDRTGEEWTPFSLGAYYATTDMMGGDQYIKRVVQLRSSGVLAVVERINLCDVATQLKAPSFEHMKAVLYEVFAYLGRLYAFLGHDYVALRVRVTLAGVARGPLCTIPKERQGRGEAVGDPIMADGTMLASRLIADPEGAMKPMLDRIWQAFGIGWAVPDEMARVATSRSG